MLGVPSSPGPRDGGSVDAGKAGKQGAGRVNSSSVCTTSEAGDSLKGMNITRSNALLITICDERVGLSIHLVEIMKLKEDQTHTGTLTTIFISMYDCRFPERFREREERTEHGRKNTGAGKRNMQSSADSLRSGCP